MNRIKQSAVSLKKYIKESHFSEKAACNEAFIIDKNTRKQLIARDSKSKEIIKPVLTGRDVRLVITRSLTKIFDLDLHWSSH